MGQFLVLGMAWGLRVGTAMDPDPLTYVTFEYLGELIGGP